MAPDARAFAKAVEPLELRSGVRIFGPNRLALIAAFKRAPGGFLDAVESLLEDADAGDLRGNLVPLFVWRIRNGAHLEQPLPTIDAA